MPDAKPSNSSGELAYMTFDRRGEARVESHLEVLIWGMDAKGLPFTQTALACNISGQGALLCDVKQTLRCGDPIVVQYRKERARFRVVWTRDSGNGENIRAAVHKLEGEECPWRDRLQLRSSPSLSNSAVAGL
jgi:hypothetical protein